MLLRFRNIIIVIVAVAAGGGGLWLLGGQARAEETALAASGAIEAIEIDIASEMPGRVAEVLVAEGHRVQVGQALIRLDDALLQTQLRQAEAGLAAAQAQAAAARANLDLLRAGTRPQEIAAGEEAVRAAQAAVTGAQAQLAEVQRGAPAADVAAVEAAVAQAAAQLKTARDAHDQTLKCYTLPGGTHDEVCPLLGTPEEQARAALAAAQEAYDAARKRLDQLAAGATKNQLDAARAQVEAAQAQQAIAEAQLDLLKSGARPEELAVAQAQVDAAQAQVDAAQTAVDALNVQLNKLVLAAPADGAILTRSIEPGEVVQPGATLLVLGRLDALTITVYVAETDYGRIQLGQPVQVTVDSYPGRTFGAQVAHIADQAQFTPRNVQTTEGRATTVYAIRLSVTNPDGALKPGMPADVTFGE